MVLRKTQAVRFVETHHLCKLRVILLRFYSSDAPIVRTTAFCITLRMIRNLVFLIEGGGKMKAAELGECFVDPSYILLRKNVCIIVCFNILRFAIL